MELKLVKGSYEYKEQIIDMLKEWIDYNENHPEANTSPNAIFRNNYEDFAYYLEHLEYKEPREGLVPDSTFFCFDEKRNLMVGAVNIRHDLNDYLLKYGGKLGLTRVLMTCDKNNIGSAKSIIRNGGILENEVWENDSVKQRYWINF